LDVVYIPLLLRYDCLRLSDLIWHVSLLAYTAARDCSCMN